MFQPVTDDDSDNDVIELSFDSALDASYRALLESLRGLPASLSTHSVRLHALKAVKIFLPQTTEGLLAALTEHPEILDDAFAPLSHEVFPSVRGLLVYHVHIKMVNLIEARYRKEFVK